MEVIKYPNKYIQKDDRDRIFIYLGGNIKNELIDYIKNNIQKYHIKYIDKMVLFNSINDIENPSEEEIKNYLKWENEYIKKSDIYTILFDNTENNKQFYDLGQYLSFFYDIYKYNINNHFIIAYTKEFNNELLLKAQVDKTINDLIVPIKISNYSTYGDLILQLLEKLYQATDSFIEHNVIHTEEQHYWSINLGPKIKKIFCQAPWPKSNFFIGITGLYGIGKTSIYHWFGQGRFIRFYDSYIGGNTYEYEVDINNKKFNINFEDTGGQDKYSNYQFRTLRKKNCVFFVFDITNRKSFDEIKNNLYPQVKDLNNNENNNLFDILIGSKLDLKYERNISIEEGEKFAEENNMKYFEVSPKTGENMEKLCNYVYDKLSKFI